MMTYVSYFREYVEKEAVRKKAEEEARQRAAEEKAHRKRAASERASKWHAIGPGLNGGWRHRYNFFDISTDSGETADLAEFQAIVTHSTECDSVMGAVQHHTQTPGAFLCSYVPSNAGTYLVTIMLDACPIAGSPYKAVIKQASLADKSCAEGPGLISSRDDQLSSFTVYCCDENGRPVAGEDRLEVSIEGEGQTVVLTKVTDNNDGSYHVSYDAQVSGSYTISVLIDGKPILGMPKQIHVARGKEVDLLVAEINKLRKGLSLGTRVYSKEESSSSQLEENLTLERDLLLEVSEIMEQIHDLRRELNMEKRTITENDVMSPHAVRDRTVERDSLTDKLTHKRQLDPIIDAIKHLRQRMNLPARVFTEQELSGSTSLIDRAHERDHLKKILPLYEEILDLHQQVEMAPRTFEEDHLTGSQSYSDREHEAQILRAMLAMKLKTNPVCVEIQKLRAGLLLSPRIFTEDERMGSNALDDRIQERDSLVNFTVLVDDIQRLREELYLPSRQILEAELSDPSAKQNLAAEVEHLEAILPLVGEIGDLRIQLEMSSREYTEVELVGPQSIAERTKERDNLSQMFKHKNACAPVCDDIQALRKDIGLAPRHFSFEELTGSSCIGDLTAERDHLREMKSVVFDIYEFWRQLQMPKHAYSEQELTGEGSLATRKQERDHLHEMLEQKNLVDPLIAEIQTIRTISLFLPSRDFSEDELWGSSAVQDRRRELTLLRNVVPLRDQIADLRRQLEYHVREYEEEELVGATALRDRTAERDGLLEKLGEKMVINPLIAEIQELRQVMDLSARVFTEDDMSGHSAVKYRTQERDSLKTMLVLFKEIQSLRQKLGWDRRSFEEGELTSTSSHTEREAERDDLLDRLARKAITDPLCLEVQQLRYTLLLKSRVFDEEEITGRSAVDDRKSECDKLKVIVALVQLIQQFRTELGLTPADYSEVQLTGPSAIQDRKNDLDVLKEVSPIANEIGTLRRQLSYPARVFDEVELVGSTAVKNLSIERDELHEKLSRKRACDPLCVEIRKLRKRMEMSTRLFSETDLCGPTAVADRLNEREDLNDMVPIYEDIHKLRGQLEMPQRHFSDEELYGVKAIADRMQERDDLRARLKRKLEIDPILAEIQKLRRQLDLSPRSFADDDSFDATAVKDRLNERHNLAQILPLAYDIHKLRRQLHQEGRNFTEVELCGPNAVADREEEREELQNMLFKKQYLDPIIYEIQKLRKRMELNTRHFDEIELSSSMAIEELSQERDVLKSVIPLYDEIRMLRNKLDMPRREYTEAELAGVDAVEERSAERDSLKSRLSRWQEVEPVLRQIQKYHTQLALSRREWNDDELYGPTAVEERANERDRLHEIVPIESEIQKLCKLLDMSTRIWQESDLTAPDSVSERIKERDELRDRYNTKKLVDPLVRQIQRLRQDMDLLPQQFTNQELFQRKAVDQLTSTRDDLQSVNSFYHAIQKLHKTLGVSARIFEEDELCGAGAALERKTEHDRLVRIPSLCLEITMLRKKLELTPREWIDTELVGCTNLEDRMEERDILLEKMDRMRVLQPLMDEIQSLRKHLLMDQRMFTESELDRDDADVMLKDEIDQLKKRINRRDEADALVAEIRTLCRELERECRTFSEEELDSPEAVPNLIVERDVLQAELNRRKAVGDLPAQIQELRRILGMVPRSFPDPIPIDMVFELQEERDDLQDECKRRKGIAKELLPNIENLWKCLQVPIEKRPNLDLEHDDIPSLGWIDRADKEHKKLRDLTADFFRDAINEQQDLLKELWNQMRVSEDARARFYRRIPDMYSEAGLLSLKEEVARLQKMLKSSKKLIKLIMKRKAFIHSMIEFEVIASDPRRLFKNSLQLNKEEQFRRTAYPSLLQLEDAIREALVKFEEGAQCLVFNATTT